MRLLNKCLCGNSACAECVFTLRHHIYIPYIPHLKTTTCETPHCISSWIIGYIYLLLFAISLAAMPRVCLRVAQTLTNIHSTQNHHTHTLDGNQNVYDTHIFDYIHVYIIYIENTKQLMNQSKSIQSQRVWGAQKKWKVIVRDAFLAQSMGTTNIRVKKRQIGMDTKTKQHNWIGYFCSQVGHADMVIASSYLINVNSREWE